MVAIKISNNHSAKKIKKQKAEKRKNGKTEKVRNDEKHNTDNIISVIWIQFQLL